MQKKILILMITVLSSFSLVAQDSLHLSLSLKEAETYALEHNRTMQNASLDVKKAYAARWQTIASMLPQVSASLDYSNMCGYEMAIMGQHIAMPPSGTLAVTAWAALS